MKKLAILFMFFLSVSIYSQKIRGIVLDSETKKPLKEAQIQINKEIITTNKKGKFSFRIPKKWNNTIFITHLSYKAKKEIFKGEREFNIFLKPEGNLLEEILVIGKKGKKELEFEKLPELPRKLHSFASVLLNNKIYVFGGDSSYEEYSYRKAMQDFADGGSAQQAGNGSLIMSSFIRSLSRYQSYFKLSDELYTYDLIKKSWVKENTKLRKRANHSAVNINDKIYIIGGKRFSTNRRKEYLDEKIEVFNPISNQIEVDNTNPHMAVNMQTIVYKDKLFAFGGSTKKTRSGRKYFSQELHSYNPKTGMWYLLAEIPISEETSTCLVDDKIYFFGGFKEEKKNMIVSLNLVSGKLKTEGKLFYDFDKPSVTKKGKVIFVFENSKLLMYNTETKELKDYQIDLPFYASKIFIQGNDLLVLGGYEKDIFEKKPQENFFKIDLAQLPKTRARKYAKL